MGRYFLYRMHPFSVGEIARTLAPTAPIHKPSPIPEDDWTALWTHGGFPEPYLRRSDSFTRRWRSFRLSQLTKEDLREVTLLQDLGTMDVLVQILAERSGQQLTYAGLAQDTNIAGDTAKRWVGLLEQMHYGFRVAPWFKSVANSLRKEPKWFLRDWSGVSDEGPRAETLVGCHLLKAVEGWTDLGLGSFDLRYVRTKLKKEVDFLVVKDGKPSVFGRGETLGSHALAHAEGLPKCPRGPTRLSSSNQFAVRGSRLLRLPDSRRGASPNIPKSVDVAARLSSARQRLRRRSRGRPAQMRPLRPKMARKPNSSESKCITCDSSAVSFRRVTGSCPKSRQSAANTSRGITT